MASEKDTRNGFSRKTMGCSHTFENGKNGLEGRFWRPKKEINNEEHLVDWADEPRENKKNDYIDDYIDDYMNHSHFDQMTMNMEKRLGNLDKISDEILSQ